MTGLGDPLAAPGLLLMAALGGLVAAPVASAISRWAEARADWVSLEVTRDPATAVAVERRLALENRADLRPTGCCWHVRQPPEHHGADRPGVALGRTPLECPGREPAARHQRLPAPVRGIQQYCHNLVAGCRPTGWSYAPAWPGAAAFDAAQPFRVVRHPGRTMLPVPDVLRRTVALAREVRPDVICFGAAFPLGLLAGRLTRATGVPCVGFTHGVEVAVGRVPLAAGCWSGWPATCAWSRP